MGGKLNDYKISRRLKDKHYYEIKKQVSLVTNQTFHVKETLNSC